MISLLLITITCNINPAYMVSALTFFRDEPPTSNMCADAPSETCYHGLWMVYDSRNIEFDLLPDDASDAEPWYHYFITNSDITESHLTKLVSENRLLFFIPVSAGDDISTATYQLYLSLFEPADDLSLSRNIIMSYDYSAGRPSYTIEDHEALDSYSDVDVVMIAPNVKLSPFAHFFNDITDYHGEPYNFAKLHYLLMLISNRVHQQRTPAEDLYVNSKLPKFINNVKAVAEANGLTWDTTAITNMGDLFTNNGKSKSVVDVFNSNDEFTMAVYQFYVDIVSGYYGKSMNDVADVMFAYVTPVPTPTPAQTIAPKPTPAQTIAPVPTPAQTIAPKPTPAQTLPPTPSPAQTIAPSLPPTPTSARTLPPTPSPAQTQPPTPTSARTLPPTPTPAQTLPSKPTPAQTLPPTPTSARTLPPTPSPAQTYPPEYPIVPPPPTPAQTLPPTPSPARTIPPPPSTPPVYDPPPSPTPDSSKPLLITLAALTGTFGLSTILLAIFTYLTYHRFKNKRAVDNEVPSDESIRDN